MRFIRGLLTGNSVTLLGSRSTLWQAATDTAIHLGWIAANIFHGQCLQAAYWIGSMFHR